MKTFVLSMFAMLLFVCTGNAQKTENAELKIGDGKNVTSYKYISLKEFQNNSTTAIGSAVRKQQETSKADVCMTTISMSVTVTAGTGVLPGGQVAVTVTGSITVPCSQALAAGIKLRDQLVDMAQG